MTFVVNFRVDGEPVGNGRPRFSRQGGFVKTYTSAKDPVLVKLDEDAKKAAPMPDSVRQKLAELKGRI